MQGRRQDVAAGVVDARAMSTIFLLSPAHSGGKRAQLIFNPNAGFELAHRLQAGEARPLGEIYSFLSGLYFRGKLAYARHFAHAPEACGSGIYVITPNRGLLEADTPITLDELRDFSRTDIESGDAAYFEPLQRDCACLEPHRDNCRIVLLGSIASGKYVDVLLQHFGNRLLFPKEFVGRGDLSRGGLMLRCVADNQELEYLPVEGAVRKGSRPPKLPRLK
jgi:hypothetical protein